MGGRILFSRAPPLLLQVTTESHVQLEASLVCPKKLGRSYDMKGIFGIYLFFRIIYCLFHSFSSPTVVTTQIRGHIAGSPPPSPLRRISLRFITRRVQPFLASSTRVHTARVHTAQRTGRKISDVRDFTKA